MFPLLGAFQKSVNLSQVIRIYLKGMLKTPTHKQVWTIVLCLMLLLLSEMWRLNVVACTLYKTQSDKILEIYQDYVFVMILLIILLQGVKF